MTTRLKTFDVTYIVTRTETYRVRAANAAIAEAEAFEEGAFIDSGETTNVQEFETVRVKGGRQ